MPKSPTAEALSQLTEVVKSIESRLTDLEASKPAPRENLEVPPEVQAPSQPENKYPIPPEYREIVDSTLNKDFGIEIEPFPDQMAFQFTIVVPEKYTDASPAYLDMYKRDLRPKVITYAEGMNGVREWARRVYENLPLDTRTKVSLARETQI